MQYKKRGFTLIEVALFLAITGALFVGIMAGVQNSIFQQRYNDSVQSFVEFLRTAYSETMNVQNLGNGRSEKAIYGKLITFGESTNLEGSPNGDEGFRNHIYMYDVVGRVGENNISVSGSTLNALNSLGANVINDEGNPQLYGIVESYVPKWGAVIQDQDGSVFSGSLLIIRHPNSGVVYTFFSNTTIQVNENLAASNLGQIKGINWEDPGIDFSIKPIDFCINPMGTQPYSNRQDVRIIRNARNGSGVELVSENGSNNVCQGNSNG